MGCTGCQRRKAKLLGAIFPSRNESQIMSPDYQEATEGFGETYGVSIEINPSTIDAHAPMESYNGRVFANPHMYTPNRDQEYDNTPIIFNRIGTRWGDLQLKNGLANGVASGRIWGYRGEGWLDNVVPVIPGQTRQIGGGNPANFVARGGAPSQYQQMYDQTAGSQPMYPGGPGYTVGTSLYNPGSGG